MGANVQIRGAEMVLQCFAARACPKWAIFVGRQFMFKCDTVTDMDESEKILADHLEMISKSGAIYTLKVYEEPGKVKEKTPCDGSFNFMLVQGEPVNDYYGQTNSDRGANREILSRLQAIELKLANEDDDDDDAPESSLGALGEILNNPQLMGIIAPVIAKMLNPAPGPGEISRPAAMAGVPDQVNGVQTDQEKIIAAVGILKQVDPKIADHLAKLAAIAKDSPAKFKGLLFMLENY